MKHYIDRLTREDLRGLCIEKDWFTGGTCEQYERMFQALEDGASVEDLATMIWMCSTDEDGQPLRRADIVEVLNERQAWPISVGYLTDTLQRNGFGETEVEIIREALMTHPDAGKAYRVIQTG